MLRTLCWRRGMLGRVVIVVVVEGVVEGVVVVLVTAAFTCRALCWRLGMRGGGCGRCSCCWTAAGGATVGGATVGGAANDDNNAPAGGSWNDDSDEDVESLLCVRTTPAPRRSLTLQ
jgi:hypothetical protein